MKKQTLIIAFAFLTIFSPTHAEAPPPLLTCPRQDAIKEYLNEIKTRESAGCDSWQQQETLLTDPDAMPAELAAFLNETIIPAQQDNLHGAGFTAHKLVYELRMHHQCMMELCEAVLKKCGNHIASSNAIQQMQTCRHKVDPLFFEGENTRHPLQVERVIEAHNTVQERKIRSTTLEKFRALEVRSRQFLIDQNAKVITNFTRLVDKVTVLLLKPM